MMSHMQLFVGWSAIVCGVGFEDQDATVLLQTKNVQEHLRHSAGNFVYDSDGAQTHNYDEVWEIPDVDSCLFTKAWKACSQYKTEAKVQAACNENPDCRGYFVYNAQSYGLNTTQIISYVLLHKRFIPQPRYGYLVYGLGTPSPKVLHVFAKDAASDLVKLGVSKAKYDYTGGLCRRCRGFGSLYQNEEDAQALCKFVGAHCVGYFVHRYWYQAVGFGIKNSEMSLMLKRRLPLVIEPIKAGATPAAKRAAKKAARKAARADKVAARAEKVAAKAAKTAASKREATLRCQNGVSSQWVDWCQCSLDGAC